MVVTASTMNMEGVKPETGVEENRSNTPVARASTMIFITKRLAVPVLL